LLKFIIYELQQPIGTPFECPFELVASWHKLAESSPTQTWEAFRRSMQKHSMNNNVNLRLVVFLFDYCKHAHDTTIACRRQNRPLESPIAHLLNVVVEGTVDVEAIVGYWQALTAMDDECNASWAIFFGVMARQEKESPGRENMVNLIFQYWLRRDNKTCDSLEMFLSEPSPSVDMSIFYNAAATAKVDVWW
jgi:hypothetical protein